MKKISFKFIGAALVAIVTLAACTKEIPVEQGSDPVLPATEGSRVMAVSFSHSTKTTLNDNTPEFEEADQVLLSNGMSTQTCQVHFVGNIPTISTHLSGTLTAVYPASAAIVSDGLLKKIEGFRVPAEQDGTFAAANIAMAENIAEDASKMILQNRTSLFIITPPANVNTLKVTSLPAVIDDDRKGEAFAINNDGEGDCTRMVTVSGKDADGRFYVSLIPGTMISDLLFGAGNLAKSFSIDYIQSAGIKNQTSAGMAYIIGADGWNTLSNTINDANEALKAGETSIEINSPTDPKTPIILPAVSDGKNISVTINGVSANEITFKLEDGAQGPANLAIDTDAQSLVINLPNSHVTVNGGTYQNVTATTSASTLVVGGDVTIGTLDIKGGNADVYGIVSNVSRASGVKVNWYADSRVKLLAGLEKSTNGESVILSSDIDLNNEDWDPVDIGKSIVFDGAGHTIRNLKIANEYDDGHYGLIGHMYSSAVIRNLTIDGAQILPPASKEGESRGAALVGIIRSGDLENCHVKNVTVSAYQKVGGLVGQVSLEASGTTYLKGCSATNVTISENMTGEGVWGAGGLIGSLCLENNGHNVTISGCSVSSISISNSTSEACPQQTAHAFIGTIRGNSNAVVTLSDNTVQQTEGLFTDIYSSDYFGWAPNTEYYGSPVNCRIVIDGKTWYPDYPFQNITKGINYLTMAQASAAASEGDVIHITKGGEYSVETLSLPAGCTLEAKAEGVTLIHTPASTSWVANCGDNTTVKNLTWNVGTANHQYFHGVNLVGCKVNGLLCTHSPNTYTDCEFYNADSYNLWEYGSGSTFVRCKFTCPGGAHGAGGGAVNAYNEGQQGMKTVIFEECQFFALTASDYYSAVYIKPETDFDVRFTGCSADDNFHIGDISHSRLWNIRDNTNINTKVSVDGTLVYSNGAFLTN